MHTIQLQIQDDLYDSITSKGIDINNKINDFLENLADDDYPSITTDEAKQRVSSAVDRYRSGTGGYTPFGSDTKDDMSNFIESL